MFDFPLSWYNSLAKPAWTPEPSTISTIWFILYPIIIASLLFVIWKQYKKQIPPSLPWFFYINAIANILFTPVLFGLQNLWMASLVILIVLITIILEIVYSWKYNKILAVAQIPYLVWVSIATTLQLSIFLMNTL